MVARSLRCRPGRRWLAVGAAALATAFASGAETPATSTAVIAHPLTNPDRKARHDHFDFVQADRHIKVWYFSPPGSGKDAPVVFVMHGVGRNGEDYLADWIPYAQERKFLLVVPEFSKAEFPGETGYIYGNTVDATGRAIERSRWSFSAIEPIFDEVRTRVGSTAARYKLYGHSAGAQFVQRFVYFIPNARVDQVVSANAGWYMLPDRQVAFPYGLKNTAVTDADLRHALALPMTVLLGTADVDPVLHSLRHTPESDAQGMFRFARGNYFYRYATEAAQKLATPLGWTLATAPGIDHSDERMAPFAVATLFQK